MLQVEELTTQQLSLHWGEGREGRGKKTIEIGEMNLLKGR